MAAEIIPFQDSSADAITGEEATFLEAYRRQDAKGKRRVERILWAAAEYGSSFFERLIALRAERESMVPEEYQGKVDELLDEFGQRH